LALAEILELHTHKLKRLDPFQGRSFRICLSACQNTATQMSAFSRHGTEIHTAKFQP